MMVISLPKNIVSTSIDHWHCMHMGLRKELGILKNQFPIQKINKQTHFSVCLFILIS